MSLAVCRAIARFPRAVEAGTRRRPRSRSSCRGYVSARRPAALWGRSFSTSLCVMYDFTQPPFAGSGIASVLRETVGAGERAEVLVERAVLLHDDDHVLDLVNSGRGRARLRSRIAGRAPQRAASATTMITTTAAGVRRGAFPAFNASPAPRPWGKRVAYRRGLHKEPARQTRAGATTLAPECRRPAGARRSRRRRRSPSRRRTARRARAGTARTRRARRRFPVRPTGTGNASMKRPIFSSSRVACSMLVSIAPGATAFSVMPAPAQSAVGALRRTHRAIAIFVAG